MIKNIKQLKSKDISKIRERILEEDQNGLCWICGKIPKRPCLDHEHKKRVKGSGHIRGVLCSNCNVFISKSENNCIRYGIKIEELPKILRKTADYLEKRQYPFIHPSEAPKPLKLMKISYNKLIKTLQRKRFTKKIPEYPKSGKLTNKLKELYELMDLKPKYYKRK